MENSNRQNTLSSGKRIGYFFEKGAIFLNKNKEIETIIEYNGGIYDRKRKNVGRGVV